MLPSTIYKHPIESIIAFTLIKLTDIHHNIYTTNLNNITLRINITPNPCQILFNIKLIQ